MMKRTGLLLVGLSALALANTALATEPTVLTDMQLDNVAAGYASVWWGGSVSTGGHRYVSGDGYQYLYLDDRGRYRYAYVSTGVNTTSYGPGTTYINVYSGADVSN